MYVYALTLTLYTCTCTQHTTTDMFFNICRDTKVILCGGSCQMPKDSNTWLAILQSTVRKYKPLLINYRLKPSYETVGKRDPWKEGSLHKEGRSLACKLGPSR